MASSSLISFFFARKGVEDYSKTDAMLRTLQDDMRYVHVLFAKKKSPKVFSTDLGKPYRF